MLPLFARGCVVHGFGRGSRQLGIPTANLPDCVVAVLPGDLKCGVYFGWASVRRRVKVSSNSDIDEHLGVFSDFTVYPSVASIGWNPFYKNTKRSLEVHILKMYAEDFYSADLRVCLAGYIRDQQDFKSTEELIAAIEKDICYAKEKLQEPHFERLRSHEFFSVESPPSYPFYGDGNNSNLSSIISTDSSAKIPCGHCGCA